MTGIPLICSCKTCKNRASRLIVAFETYYYVCDKCPTGENTDYKVVKILTEKEMNEVRKEHEEVKNKKITRKFLDY